MRRHRLGLLGGVGLFLSTSVSWAASARPELATHRYEPARLGRKLEFPRDHGAHRNAAYEWWYLTGHLYEAGAQTTVRERAGFQLTVFRISALGRPSGASTLIAHLAISDLERNEHIHRSFGLPERTSVQVADSGLDIRMPGLRITQDPKTQVIQVEAKFSVSGVEREISGKLQPAKPLVLHGKEGFSRKGPCETCASHYSSWPRLEGNLRVRSGERSLEGFSRVWFDHEFGSNSLEQNQAGWDWFAIQLRSGWDLMLFQLRDLGQKTHFVSGTWIDPQGRSGSIDPAELRFDSVGHWKSPRSGARYPARFSVHWSKAPAGVPQSLEVVPKFADQEVFSGDSGLATYWEGTCSVRSGDQTLGDAYLEMTGYDPARRPRF